SATSSSGVVDSADFLHPATTNRPKAAAMNNERFNMLPPGEGDAITGAPGRHETCHLAGAGARRRVREADRGELAPAANAGITAPGPPPTSSRLELEAEAELRLPVDLVGVDLQARAALQHVEHRPTGAVEHAQEAAAVQDLRHEVAATQLDPRRVVDELEGAARPTRQRPRPRRRLQQARGRRLAEPEA